MNQTQNTKIHVHKQRKARRHILLSFAIIFVFLCIGLPLSYYLYKYLNRSASVTITAENAQILQGEALPEFQADITWEGDRETVLDKADKLTAGDIIDMLKSGSGYSISCEADPNVEGTYPIQLSLDSDLQKKLDSESWNGKLTISLNNANLTVKNPVGEWDGNKFKRYDGTYVTDAFVTSMGKQYYFDSDGIMVTGWNTIQNSVYHFSDEGVMETNTWAERDGDRYYLGENGAAVTGWQDIDGNSYYFDSDGIMATGTIYIGLSKCKFDSFGKFLSKTDSKIDPGKPAIALTFDDGPGPRTAELLEALEEYNAHATFFMLGNKIPSYPDVIKKMEEIGCELGNHSYDHANLTKISADQIASQINQTNSNLQNIVGSGATVMRPPYGAINSTVKSTAGMPLILWNIDTLDWKTRNTKSTIDAVMGQVKDGDIILMHDIHTETIDAALQLIPKLQEAGFQLVTVSELASLKGITLQNGEKYTDF